MKYFSISPRLLLPLIVVMGVLIIGIRIEDIWDAAASGRLFAPQTAHAATTAPETPAPAPAPAAASAAAAPAPVPAVDAGAMLPASGAPPADEDMSPAEMEVLKQLGSRRDALDKRSRDLDQRQAIIKVAEQRVDAKIKEMEALRQQLQGMVNQVSETQQAQLDNIVKIYETMKPEDAAKIFESLDMPTLLGVVQRMKPKSTAPIMAKMAPEKAKELTVALTKQDQLPQVK